MKRKVQEKKEAKTKAMLEKGMDILWSNGYNGTSVNDIVAAADVPKGSFYYYFESKDDFVIKALDRYFTIECEPAFHFLEEEGKTPKERLLNFYQSRNEQMKKEMNCERGSMICNIGNEMSEHNDRIRQKINSLHKTIYKKIIKVVAEAQKDGSMKNDIATHEMVGFIENVFDGAIITMKENKSGQALDSAFEIVKRTFFK